MHPDHERRQAHSLLDMLPDEKVSAVRNLLQVMVEPLSHSLESAPEDDEDLTPEALERLRRARASMAAGEGITHDDVLREFGLKK